MARKYDFLLSCENIRDLIDYDYKSGKFYNKFRGIEWFGRTNKFDETANMNRWNNRYAGKEIFKTPDDNYYLQGEIFGRKFYAHRVAFLWMEKRWPNYDIDHINHYRQDNRWINLREVSRTENLKNKLKGSNNKSGTIGIFRLDEDHWVSFINDLNGKRIHLGTSYNEEDAINLRKEAEIKYKYHENHGKEVPLDDKKI